MEDVEEEEVLDAEEDVVDLLEVVEEVGLSVAGEAPRLDVEEAEDSVDEASPEVGVEDDNLAHSYLCLSI